MDYKKLSELIPYENNPRNNEKAVSSVANSIKEFGFKVPIVIDKNNIIVAGHTRYLAAKQLGINEVPVVIADDLNDEQIKAFRLADNKVGELADWDWVKLDTELTELNNLDWDMSEFGFDMDKAFEQDADFSDFFNKADDEQDGDYTPANEYDKTPKTITCPHCGGAIEV